MLTKIQIIILILSLIDLTASFFYISTFHNQYPNADYTQIEANPILKISMRQFGIKIGMLVGGIIVFGILLLLVLNLKENYHYFLVGALSTMLIYHFLNFYLLRINN